MTQIYKYELAYYELGSESWVAQFEGFDSWDEATERAHRLNLDYIDFEKGGISITEFSLDEEGNIDSAIETIEPTIVDDKIVGW